MMPTRHENLVANLVGQVRRERLNGRDHFVAPITLIVPGVLSGSKGPLLYPLDELKNSVKQWEKVPLVVYHPHRNGKPVSAHSEGILDKSGVGFLADCKIQNGKLVAEGWFDAEKTKLVDPRVYEALINGSKMEISTGLGVTAEEAPPGSSWLGQPYVAIARNHRPDHLALLPTDQRGACSLNDGCGLLANVLEDQ